MIVQHQLKISLTIIQMSPKFSSNDVDAVVGFFEQEVLKTSSINTAAVILKQAKIDNVKVFELLDSLKGLDKVQLSYIVTEVLNNSRSLTSFWLQSRIITNLSEKET